ncbi:hypothetical protein DAEQUDRAFT_710009 [Daedalea quercina L-15889]|uniref:Uncharacterized protein n=1 Tax=Daedalea quercina L-15889 TaxID=1314783 RepID=A0A165QII9_9APHY|nr:hypothetical protein DAEQUDRAFT_710009 [Daedalea quercina L-15889]
MTSITALHDISPIHCTMRNFPLAEAQLTALFMQSIMYGVHAVAFTSCIYTWFKHSSSSTDIGATRRWLWMLISITFFIVGTCDVFFNYYHNLVAFIFYRGPGGASEEFAQFTNRVNFMRVRAITSLHPFQIYRCWLVHAYSRRRTIVAIMPLVLWLGWLALTIVLVYYSVALKNATSIPATQKIQPFIYACYSISLTINIFSTGLIIDRLWRFHRRDAEIFRQDWRVPGRLDFVQIIVIIVESALLYTATVIICMVLDVAGTDAYYGATDISLEAAGISFDLITIRIWNGVSTEQTQIFANTALRLSKTRMTAPHDKEASTASTDILGCCNTTLSLRRSPEGMILKSLIIPSSVNG